MSVVSQHKRVHHTVEVFAFHVSIMEFFVLARVEFSQGFIPCEAKSKFNWDSLQNVLANHALQRTRLRCLLGPSFNRFRHSLIASQSFGRSATRGAFSCPTIFRSVGSLPTRSCHRLRLGFVVRRSCTCELQCRYASMCAGLPIHALLPIRLGGAFQCLSLPFCPASWQSFSLLNLLILVNR